MTTEKRYQPTGHIQPGDEIVGKRYDTDRNNKRVEVISVIRNTEQTVIVRGRQITSSKRYGTTVHDEKVHTFDAATVAVVRRDEPTPQVFACVRGNAR